MSEVKLYALSVIVCTVDERKFQLTKRTVQFIKHCQKTVILV